MIDPPQATYLRCTTCQRVRRFALVVWPNGLACYQCECGERR
ncbi:MAG: hypothetical protein ACLFVJ_21800 [Persicimonas sp.]